MASNEIKIVVGGDPSGFVAAARDVSSSLDRIRNSAKGPAEALPKVDNAAASAGAALKSKIVPGANQAAFALQNVGRVAQDLPFGFIGIQNNLNPLLESFQRLKAETGSSGAALKALGGSLIGAGGIGLALSVVSSAILIFQNGIGGFGKKAKEAKEAADELAKSIRDISLIQGEAVASVEGQVAQVQSLANAISDSNKPYDERKRALEELREINKNYFGDLKLEDAATGALAKTVQEYTNALINSAIQKQFVDEIAKVAKAVVDSDNEIKKSKDKLNAASSDASKKQIEAANRQVEANKRGAIAQSAITDPEVQRALKAQAEAQDELSIANEKSTKLLEQEALLREQLNKAVGEGLKFKDLNNQSSKKEEDLLKKRLETLQKIQELTKDAGTRVGIQEQIFELQVKIAVRDQGKNQISNTELNQQINGFKSQLQQEFDKQAIELEAIPKVKFSQTARAEISTKEIQSEVAKATGFDKKIPIETQFEVNAKLFGIKFAQTEEQKKKAIAQLQDSINSIVSNVQVEGLASIGEDIGNAIAGGGSVFKSLFDVLATGLQQLGKALIAYGLALKGFRLAIKSLNPAVALIAGIAAVAAGTAIKASLPKFADGGIATKATLGIFGEAGKEAIIPLDKLPELMGKVNFSNQEPIILQPSLNFSLTDMQIRLERVTDRRRRLG